MSSTHTYRLNANGRYTIGNCRPLLPHTVMICTALASLSRRRLRSAGPLRSSRWRRSQSRSAGRLNRSRWATSCSRCATCARSVIVRSPPGRLSTRSPMPATCAASNTAAIPRSRAWSDHCRIVSVTCSVSASPRPRGRRPSSRRTPSPRPIAPDRCGAAGRTPPAAAARRRRPRTRARTRRSRRCRSLGLPRRPTRPGSAAHRHPSRR